MSSYINYDKIKNNKEGDILVKCYFTGKKWLCPDPKNIQLSENMYGWYMSSHNIIYSVVMITDEMYNCLDIWTCV